MVRKIKAILFDMDGVMVDSEIHGMKSFEYACNTNGFKFEECFYLSTLGKNYVECDRLYKQYFGSEDLFNKIMKTYDEVFQAAYPKGEVLLKKGCREIIAYLQENNIPYCLATSSPYRMVERTFLNQGYDVVPFKHVITGDKVEHSKPHPEIFIKGAELMNVDIKDCMIVEDSYNGILAARRSGAITVLVPDLIAPTEEVLGYADYVKESLFEVKDLAIELLQQ